MLNFEFDFKNPNYVEVIRWRAERLGYLRRNPEELPKLIGYYKNNIAQFIMDWGVTADPRNVDRKLPVSIPFILFPRQIEFVNWLLESWRNKENVIVEKSRDMGVTWICVAVACAITLFNPGAVFGFGSRKEIYVDKLGDLDSIMEKARFFLLGLPKEFRGGFNLKQHSREMLLMIPASKGAIKGEAGTNIGRGGRTTGYFVDEAAFLQSPELIEASLSNTTNFRVDISTPHGMGNPFAQKRFSGNYKVFRLHWRDDPRKDSAWYERMQLILDPITLAQEVDLNYSGSVEGIVIPANWVHAAIDAHIKLGYSNTGIKRGGLDVADEGKDKNVFCVRHGVTIEYVKEWSGKDSDILYTAQETFGICRQFDVHHFHYDAIGVGSGIKGDIRLMNEKNEDYKVEARGFRGNSKVWMPYSQMVRGMKNEDLFANLKAQAWWQLRIRFQNTFRAVTQGVHCDPNSTISIPGTLPNLAKIIIELSQPTYTTDGAGKLIIDKKPRGAISPNIADAIVIAFHDMNDSIHISDETLNLFGNK